MSKGNTFENEFLLHVFNNADIPLIGDAIGLRGSTTAGSLYLSLHSADPGEAGDQSTGEISYTGYSRVAVARSGAGFTVAANAVTLAANQAFGACTAGSATATHFAIGTAASGAGKILYRGPIGARLGAFIGATGDTITIPGLTGLAVDDRITFRAGIGQTLPTGITEGVVYWVKTVSVNDITISTTQGGATLDITGAGTGIAYEVNAAVISAGTTPSLTTGTTVTED